MEKDNIQKELFEFDPPKKQPNRFGRFFQKTDIAISLGAEKLVFISIGIMMLFVVSFALGVERGKAISGRTEQADTGPAQTSVQRTGVAVPARKVYQAKTVISAANITPKDKAQASIVKTASSLVQAENPVVDKTKPYTIVVAAFSKEVFATKEARNLKTSGLEAFVYYSEPYYLACVGSFANKDSAQKILGKVRQIHRDAYVRLK